MQEAAERRSQEVIVALDGVPLCQLGVLETRPATRLECSGTHHDWAVASPDHVAP